jgi:hypothetical protein
VIKDCDCIWCLLFALSTGMDVSIMGIITIKAELLPWFFCAQGLLLDGMIMHLLCSKPDADELYLPK